MTLVGNKVDLQEKREVAVQDGIEYTEKNGFSVPLKTYLPDGDIDLTALNCHNIEDGLVFDVRVVLHGEKINEAAEYEVKDVIFIDAEMLLPYSAHIPS
ncbi:P-loop containing nucleoside triphosphate hydrolase [Vigna unguiculata]|uniref:P-loop containing nucleoside triphosphate hydrolase n=1 Tax=Vigna unguiculata TaxID=3917 RepID=A0A4D6KKS6_VIGUN|nr:P-loop containing nucleoside triphosphate hydrolase [Vigna unguiculata]